MESCGNPSITRYQDFKCRCDACREVARVSRARARLKAFERERGAIFESDLLPADETVRRLREIVHWRKVPREEIARMTGVSSFTIGRLVLPKIRKGNTTVRDLRQPENVTRRVELAVAKVHAKVFENVDEVPRDLQPGSLVPAKKTKQVLYSLCAQGWSTQHQADIIFNNLGETGMILTNIRANRKYVQKITEDKVLWLAHQLGNATGPSVNNIAKFRKRGIFPNRHYSLKGDLIVSSLSAEQRAIYERVRSTHG